MRRIASRKFFIVLISILFAVGHSAFAQAGSVRDHGKQLMDLLEQYNKQNQKLLESTKKPLQTKKQPKDTLEAKAEQGDAAAQHNLALKYYNGNGVPQDYKKAVYWWKKSAEQGLKEAQFCLGVCYEDGLGVTKDFSQAVYWWKKSAEQGYVNAQYNIGLCYYNGTGVAKDYKAAAYWWKKAAEQGDADSQYEIGNLCFLGKGVDNDFKYAFYWFTKSAEQGNADAQDKLGTCYFWGYGTEKNYVQAFNWWKKSAEQNNADGQYSLGTCYYSGNGVKQDYKQAFYWFTKAAEQGYAFAQLNLALCYFDGNGVAKDNKQAVYWFTKAAEQGIVNAQFMLGMCYGEGIGVEEDFAKAFYWWKKAAEQGDAEAQYYLGGCYITVIGTQQDIKQGEQWLKKSAKQGNEEAKELLAQLLNAVNSGADISQLSATQAPAQVAQSWSYPTSEPTPTWTGSGTEQDPYIITTAQQLADMAYLVNKMCYYSSYTRAHYALGADIDLNPGITVSEKTTNAKQWIPIGGFANETYGYVDFCGVFDGRMHRIDGLYINDQTEHCKKGLFGKVCKGVVKNIIIGKGYVGAPKGTAGAIAAAIEMTAKIICCGNEGTNVVGGYYAGGIIGEVEYCEDSSWKSPALAFLYNKASVTVIGSLYSGGIVGDAKNWSYRNKKLESDRPHIIGCYNIGSVFGNHKGGILGGDDISMIKNCFYLKSCGASDFIAERKKFHSTKKKDNARNLSELISCSAFSESDKAALLQNLNSASGNIWVQGADGWPTFKGAE